jgi:hypothetical protein
MYASHARLWRLGSGGGSVVAEAFESPGDLGVERRRGGDSSQAVARNPAAECPEGVMILQEVASKQC